MTDLPNGWKIKRLDEIADIVMGQSPPGISYNEHGEGRPFFQGKTEFGEVHPTVRKYTTAGTKFAKAGDILMSVRAPVGPTNIADIDCVIGRGLAAIRAKTVVSQDYLRWSLKHLEIDIQSKGTGTTFDAITGETLRGTLIALPPIPEQQKIVEILEDHLSRLDAALADVKQAKFKAAQFRRSLLQAAFTGNLNGHGTGLMTYLPNGWSYESINSIVAGGMIADGDWVESKDQDPNGQVRLTQLADVGDGEFRSRSDRWMNDEQASRLNVNYLQKGDLLMARMPDPLGRTCMVPDKIGRAVTVVDVAIIRITRKDVNPKFVMWLLNSPGIRQQIEMLASGTTRRRITRKNLGTIDLPVPPFEEQCKIVEIVEDHLSRLEALVAIADEIERQSSSLRRSLLQAAFTGQLTKEVLSV